MLQIGGWDVRHLAETVLIMKIFCCRLLMKSMGPVLLGTKQHNAHKTTLQLDIIDRSSCLVSIRKMGLGPIWIQYSLLNYTPGTKRQSVAKEGKQTWECNNLIHVLGRTRKANSKTWLIHNCYHNVHWAVQHFKNKKTGYSRTILSLWSNETTDNHISFMGCTRHDHTWNQYEKYDWF